METIGLSCKTKTRFLIPEDIDWQKYLFPGGLALVNNEGTVHYEHLSSFIGNFPTGEEIVEKIMLTFGELNELTREESVKYLKDGMKFYIAPKFERFQYEKNSGFYYDPETTLYYEAKSGYFFDGDRAIYLYWCDESKCYLPVPVAGSSTESVSFLKSIVTEYNEEPAVEPEPDMKESTEPGLEIKESTEPGLKMKESTVSGSEMNESTEPRSKITESTEPGSEDEIEKSLPEFDNTRQSSSSKIAESSLSSDDDATPSKRKKSRFV